MTQKLLLWAHSTPEHSRWALFSDDTLQQTGMGFSGLPSTDSLDVTLIIPSEEVLLTQVTLPKMRRKQFQLALPFALEEQLISDVDQLHFATGEMQPDNLWPVAIIAKEKLQQWLVLMREHNIQPDTILPDIFTLPLTEKQWTVLVDKTRCIIRTGHYSGFTAEHSQLITLLNAARQGAAQAPECINLLSSTPISPIALNDVKTRTTTLSENELLQQCYDTLQKYPSINLLQGQWQQNHHTDESRRLWHITAMLATVWIVIVFSSQIFSMILLKHQSDQLNQSIHAIYHRYFPTATSMVAPKERLQQKLNAIHGQGQQNRFLTLLASTGEVLAQNPAAQLKQIEFNNHMLHLDIEANSFNMLDTLITQLKTTGLQVKQQNATIDGRNVRASLLIQ